MGTFQDLKVYIKAFDLAMEIFELSKGFPKEETYSLTDQIRRCSRSVCTSFAEGYRKGDIRCTSLVNQRMQIWKTVRRRCGWILQVNVVTWKKMNVIG